VTDDRTGGGHLLECRAGDCTRRCKF
jgi:hypothetical protein